jgi:O-antigen/teichoic acid export membrane protein
MEIPGDRMSGTVVSPSSDQDISASRPNRHSPTAVARHLIVGQLVVVGASLATNVAAARTMGPGGRGQLALFLQVAYVLYVVGMAGTDRSYPASLTGVPSLPAAARDLRRLTTPTALLVMVACAVAGPLLDDGSPAGAMYGAALGLVVLGNLLMCALRTATVAAGSTRLHFRLNLAGQVLLIGLAWTLAVADIASPLVWLLAYGVALCLPSLVGRLTTPTGPAVPGRRDHSQLAVARKLGWRLLPATLASITMLRADRLLLPALGSYEQLGVYIVAATLSEMIVLPVQTIVDAHVPRWRARILAGASNTGRILLLAIGYAVASIAAVTGLGSLLMVPVFGAAYAASVSLLFPLTAAAGLWAVSRVAVGLLTAAGSAGSVLRSDGPAMVLSIIAYCALIPRYGALGAAWGSACGYGLAAVLSVLMTLRGRLATERGTR